MNKSKSCLLFLYPVIDAAGSGLVCPEQTDRAGPVGIQRVSRFISHHQVQPQNPEQHRGSNRISWVYLRAIKTLQWCLCHKAVCCKSAGFVPVSVINLCCDFLSELHKVILRQRSRHYLGSIFDEAVCHLLNTPEQGDLVRLSDRDVHTSNNTSFSGVKQKEKKWYGSECVLETERLIRLYIPRRACAISAPIPSEWPRAPAPGASPPE